MEESLNYFHPEITSTNESAATQITAKEEKYYSRVSRANTARVFEERRAQRGDTFSTATAQPRARNTADLLARYKNRDPTPQPSKPLVSKFGKTKGGYQTLAEVDNDDELRGARNFGVGSSSRTSSKPSAPGQTVSSFMNYFSKK
jgi:hypothetical protein